MTDNADLRKKRVIYRAIHRGFKEADLLIGGFAREAYESLDETELAAFESLLELNDHDVYGWIMGTKPVPEEINPALIAKMRAYADQDRPA